MVKEIYIQDEVYCRGCGEADYVCRRIPCGDVNCECNGTTVIGPNGLLLIPNEVVNFAAFGECIAWWSWMMRLQLIYSTATDDVWAAKHFKAYSATRRLAVVAHLCNAENLEVTSE